MRLIYAHMFMNIFSSLVVSTSRLHLLKQLRPLATTSELNATTTTWQATITAIEFLFQPTFGKLSDAIGRKQFLLIAPLANLVLKTWMALAPSTLALSMEAVIGDGLRVLGTTMVSSSVADLTTDQSKLAVNLSLIGASGGAAVLLGTLAGGQLVSATGGNLLAPYYLSAFMAGCLTLMDATLVQESLSPSKRRPFPGLVNPLAFTKLFRTGHSTFSTLNAVQGLNYCCETKNVAAILSLYGMNQLRLDPTAQSRVVAAVGLSMVMQAPIQKALMPKLGMQGFTTVANLATAAGYALRGSIQSLWATYAGIMFGFFGEARASGNKARTVKLVDTVGMGIGEMNGYHANLRAVCGLAVTLLYSRAYEVAPGAPWLLVSLLGLVTEALCRTLTS